MIIGNRYGNLTVIARAESIKRDEGGSFTQYICECKCGNARTFRKVNLISGNTQSCCGQGKKRSAA